MASKPLPFICSFPPVADKTARVLILGSMPGEKSLSDNQYYAHPQNAFWKIMGELFGASRDVAYAKRLKLLQANHIALWDVLATCVREGSSLDSAIANESANDFASFLKKHSHITHIFFNGTKAETSFKKFAYQTLPRKVMVTRLPSTSPANASYSFERKLSEWRQILQIIGEKND